MTIPLVYHFTGVPLPGWARVTLRNAGRKWPGAVVLIHDRILEKPIPEIEVHSPENWYDPRPFQSFDVNFLQPKNFRGGFWHHAMERFFMLAQWAEANACPRFLHSELDVLLMNHQAFAAALPREKGAVMYPRASDLYAGANILYVDGLGALQPLLDFFTANSGPDFEMNLLARFLDERPDCALSLPSHFDLEKEVSKVGAGLNVSLAQLGGVVDVHPMGTWIFGHDPRNTLGFVFNHFYYPTLGGKFLERLKYRFSWRSSELLVENTDGSCWPIYALHVHSKLMLLAHNRLGLWMYSWLANRSWRSVVILQNIFSVVARQLRKIVNRRYLSLVLRPKSIAMRDRKTGLVDG